jgi:tRNA threonylcarbamoyl adenosine modification protein YjeE
VPQAGQHTCRTAEDTLQLGSALARDLVAGDVLLLYGELGAGKTTFVRGMLRALGWTEPVRSPTFTLVQAYPTSPQLLHVDLYRVSSASGLGLEDYFATHICAIEWPDRLQGLVVPESCWRLQINFAADGRLISISAPDA